MNDLLRFPTALEHDPAIDVWLRAQRPDLQSFVETWFTCMRRCGSDVRELRAHGRTAPRELPQRPARDHTARSLPGAQGVWRQAQAQGESLDRIEAGQRELGAQLALLVAAQKGVPDSTLQAILARFGEVGVPSDQLQRRLDEEADECLRLKAHWEAHASPDLLAIRARALALLNEGDLDSARQLLRAARQKSSSARWLAASTL